MSTTINKPHAVDELSALFDEINVGSNLDIEKSTDYGTSTVDKAVRPFEDKVADVRAVMEPEPPLAEVEKIPEPVIESKAESKIEPEPEPESTSTSTSTFTSTSTSTSTSTGAVSESPEIQQTVEQMQQVEPNVEESNPLNLKGANLHAYELIKKKYPQFQLYDGNHAYKEFYRYKVQSLKNLLARYGVLPLDDMKKEMENIKLDRRLGPNLADPVVIGQCMDESIAGRGRLASLLAKAQIQLPAWKKTFEWLNSKVWKDHESKGAHKRDSLALEHNSDMKDYYSELQGFVDAATTIDSFLKSQHDSYSRQLSCVDIREKVGVVHEAVASEIEQATKPELPPSTDSELDGLDTLESGTLIKKVPIGGLVEKDFPGAEIESEFLDGIGG